MDLEGIDSPTRFVELVIHRALTLLPATGKMKKWWDERFTLHQALPPHLWASHQEQP